MTVDLDQIRRDWLAPCAPCRDYILKGECGCLDVAERVLISDLCAEVERLRARLAFSRTSHDLLVRTLAACEPASAETVARWPR